jgi:hypothetical protein
MTPAADPARSRARGSCGQRQALPTGAAKGDGGPKGENRTFLSWRKPDICTLGRQAKMQLLFPSTRSGRKTHVPPRRRFFDPGVCSRSGSVGVYETGSS